MSRRFGTILLLLFQALWLNVILPGHTRGIVTMPGWKPADCHTAAAAKGCCASEGGSDTKSAPGEDRASNCAVCFFAARLTTPPVIDLTPPALELLAVRPAPAPHVLESADPVIAYFGRAPPGV